MKKFDENQVQEAIKRAPADAREIVSGIYTNPALEEMIGTEVDDYEIIEIDLADAITYRVLGLITMSEYRKDLAEILWLEKEDEIDHAVSVINDFIILKKHILSDESKTHGKIEKDSISHIDILNEIENPTPSIINPQRINPARKNEGPAKNDIDKTSDENEEGPALSAELGGFAPANSQNPAQKIAAQLDKNLSTPSTSIPKEVYVSKKPDPYKEPII